MVASLFSLTRFSQWRKIPRYIVVQIEVATSGPLVKTNYLEYFFYLKYLMQPSAFTHLTGQKGPQMHSLNLKDRAVYVLLLYSSKQTALVLFVLF